MLSVFIYNPKNMPAYRVWIGLSALCLGLVSCSSMSPKECQLANWRDIGQTDGMAGKTLSLFNERRSDCAEANVQADQTAYLSGREQGLTSYCQPANAVQVGLRGEAYEGVCPPAIDQEFRRRHRIGFDIHRFHVEIGRLHSRYDALEQRYQRNRHEFDKRLGARGRNEDFQRLYRSFEHDQFMLREEQRAIINALQWNKDQLHNAEAVLEKLR